MHPTAVLSLLPLACRERKAPSALVAAASTPSCCAAALYAHVPPCTPALHSFPSFLQRTPRSPAWAATPNTPSCCAIAYTSMLALCLACRERQDPVCWRPPQEHHHAVLRRLWRAAPRGQADQGAGHVLLCQVGRPIDSSVLLLGALSVGWQQRGSVTCCLHLSSPAPPASAPDPLLRAPTLPPLLLLLPHCSGYTAKVAGTEQGVTEPEATFSACFGSAFLMWHPVRAGFVVP